MISLKRGLHTTANLAARTRYSRPKPPQKVSANPRLPTQLTHHHNNLKVTAPIPPAAANLECPEDHPLWQFFSDKQFLRPLDQLDSSSRPWSVPELRRKSFEDLHSLWYTCLKERNILAREHHLSVNGAESQQDSYNQLAEKIRTTMWRIRHVLSERDWAFKITKNSPELENMKVQYFKEFEKEFLELDKELDDLAFERLERFQWSMFGISEIIEENKDIGRVFVDGMKMVANLKLKKFSERDGSIKKLLEDTPNNTISDVGETFVVFTSEHTLKDVKEACDTIRELRANGNSVARIDELPSMRNYIKQLKLAQLRDENANEASTTN